MRDTEISRPLRPLDKSLIAHCQQPRVVVIPRARAVSAESCSSFLLCMSDPGAGGQHRRLKCCCRLPPPRMTSSALCARRLSSAAPASSSCRAAVASATCLPLPVPPLVLPLHSLAAQPAAASQPPAQQQPQCRRQTAQIQPARRPPTGCTAGSVAAQSRSSRDQVAVRVLRFGMTPPHANFNLVPDRRAHPAASAPARTARVFLCMPAASWLRHVQRAGLR